MLWDLVDFLSIVQEIKITNTNKIRSDKRFFMSHIKKRSFTKKKVSHKYNN